MSTSGDALGVDVVDGRPSGRVGAGHVVVVVVSGLRAAFAVRALGGRRRLVGVPLAGLRDAAPRRGGVGRPRQGGARGHSDQGPGRLPLPLAGMQGVREAFVLPAVAGAPRDPEPLRLEAVRLHRGRLRTALRLPGGAAEARQRALREVAQRIRSRTFRRRRRKWQLGKRRLFWRQSPRLPGFRLQGARQWRVAAEASKASQETQVSTPGLGHCQARGLLRRRRDGATTIPVGRCQRPADAHGAPLLERLYGHLPRNGGGEEERKHGQSESASSLDS